MAAGVAHMGPLTSGVSFTARPALRTANRNAILARHSADIPVKRSIRTPQSDSGLAANPKLSVIEVEALLREKVKTRSHDIQQGFQNYDVDETLCITKGEFRRVLESYCFSMTTEQFEAVLNKVEINPNGTVRYCDFLEKFSGRDTGRSSSASNWRSGSHRFIQTQSPKEMNTDMVEKILREKIAKNVKNVVKALRLYDYNRDGHIQRHELRKVLENYCFHMTDQQFDKLYQRYDFHHRGVLNYREFLQRMGIPINRQGELSANATHPSTQGQPEKDSIGAVRPSTIHGSRGDNFAQVEVEFRKKMKSNYANIKRMFMVFDKHLDGLIALDDLKAILNEFTVPMSNQLFAQLMEKFSFKASGKISWEYFLEKFQDPQAHGNGQTIPIKPNHKFFPGRGGSEKIDTKEIIRLLHEHVTNAYSSFKKAFLQIDKNRDGRISRKELRKVLDNFKFRIEDGQFKELMIHLDPQHTNFIDYHKFLHLFEEKETQEGHKWLKSCHRYNETQKPVIMAWETVEDILREKLSEHWKAVAEAIVTYDALATGRIAPHDLRRVIGKFALPVSKEHFEHMMGWLVDTDQQGGVNYVEFLSKLGVVAVAGDVQGLSTQIQDENHRAGDRRKQDHQARQEIADKNAMERVGGMSTDEILVRLKDKLSQHSTRIREAFHQFDRKNKGKISKKDLRSIVEEFGIYMDDDQYRDLCSRLAFRNGQMSYSDFVQSFQDLRINGPSGQLNKVSNHRVNPIRGDEYGMSAIEVQSKLRSKLRENFENLRAAFYKFDDDHNGVLTKKNFRRMLDSFMCVMSDDQFEQFCQHLAIDKQSRITYQDFLDRFETRDSFPEGHKWLNSDHRYNETKLTKLLTAEEVHSSLVDKAHRQWPDLAKAFRNMDGPSNVIRKKDLRSTLYNFILPMNKAEFTRLWERYDREGKGFVTYEDFLERLSGDQFTPADGVGVSHQIAADNYKTIVKHVEDQQAKQEQITQNQAAKVTLMRVDDVIRELKDRIRDQYSDFQTAFKKYDKRQKGYLSVTDIQRVLVDFNYILDDDQLYDFLERLGMNSGQKRLSYEDFLKVFEEGRKDNYPKKEANVQYPTVNNADLSPDEAETKLQRQISSQADVIQSAFQAFDKQYNGCIKAADFRRVLDNFCFKMTDKQFKHLMKGVVEQGDNMVDYNTFMQAFRESEAQDSRKWLEGVQKRMQDKRPHFLSMEEIHSHLQEKVTSKFYLLAKAFADIDYARIGVISKDDFKDILYKYTIRISDEQFEKLWATLKVNDYGNLDYHDFLRSYTMESADKPGSDVPNEDQFSQLPRTSSLGMFTRRPHTSYCETGRSLRSSVGGNMARPFTPLVNAEDTEKKLKDRICRNWKDIQRHCRILDAEDSGQINQEDFRSGTESKTSTESKVIFPNDISLSDPFLGIHARLSELTETKDILDRYHVSVSEDELRKLLLKYDLRNNNTFCYPEFLRHFVLNMRTNEDTSLLTKRKNAQANNTDGGTQRDSDAAMMRLRRCVLDNWKDMRREFRLADPNGIGLVNLLDFRQVLRNHNADLSETEFSSVATMFDPDLSGMISYNDVIKTSLRNI